MRKRQQFGRIAGIALGLGVATALVVPNLGFGSLAQLAPASAATSTAAAKQQTSFTGLNWNTIIRAVEPGTTRTLTGTVSGGARTLVIYEQQTGKAEQRVGTAETTSSGAFRITVKVNAEHIPRVCASDCGVDRGSAQVRYRMAPHLTSTLTTSHFKKASWEYYAATGATLTGKVSAPMNREVQLQQSVKVNGWTKTVTIATTTTSSTGAFSISFKPEEGAQLRLYAPAVGEHKEVATSYAPVTTKPVGASIKQPSLGDDTRIVPWKQNYISTYIGNVYSNLSPTVVIQEKSGNSWKEVSRTNPKVNVVLSLKVPKGTTASADGVKTYRVVAMVPGMPTTYSKAVSVTWDNPYKGSATERQAYNYIKKYCPDTFVQIANIPNGVAGQALLSEGGIKISSAVSKGNLQTVALHECAHIRQYAMYAGNWGDFQKRTNKLYGGSGWTGMERQAECIANVWAKNSYWAYTPGGAKGCTGAKLDAAKKIAAGKKW